MEGPLNLPERYLEEIKNLLGTEYEDWLSAMEEPAVTGLHTNDLKTDPKGGSHGSAADSLRRTAASFQSIRSIRRVSIIYRSLPR